MIERGGPWTLVARDDGPLIVSIQRAKLACGCSVYVGLRTDNQEAATVSKECSPAHAGLMRRFNDAYRESLADPQDRSAVEVADEILLEACYA